AAPGGPHAPYRCTTAPHLPMVPAAPACAPLPPVAPGSVCRPRAALAVAAVSPWRGGTGPGSAAGEAPWRGQHRRGAARFSLALVGFQGRGFADGVQPNFCYSLLLEAFI